MEQQALPSWTIRPLHPGDVRQLRKLDLEIVSSWALVVEKMVDGLAVTWRLAPRRLEPPFRSTHFAPTAQEWEELERNLAAGAREGFTVEAAGSPVGFVELEEQTWRNAGFIWNLLVHRTYRGQGVGTALLQAAVAWGRERELRALALETQTNNWDAINFYRKRGFVPCGVDDHYYANDDVTAGEVALFWYYELGSGDGC